MDIQQLNEAIENGGQVELESIIHFQSVDDFNEGGTREYNDMCDAEIFSYLEQWWYPSEHDTNWYDASGVDTNFLGYVYEAHGEIFLLSNYSSGLVIGLSRIISTK